MLEIIPEKCDYIKVYLPIERNCDGATLVNFLKATLKAERVLNPHS